MHNQEVTFFARLTAKTRALLVSGRDWFFRTTSCLLHLISSVLVKAGPAILGGGSATRAAIEVIATLRIPLIVGSLIGIAFLAPEQSREIFRALAEAPEDNVGLIVIAITGVAILAFGLHFVCVAILVALRIDRPRLSMIVVGCIGALPFAGASLGLLLARVGNTFLEHHAINRNLRIACIACAVVSVLAFCVGALMTVRRSKPVRHFAALFAKPAFVLISLVAVVGSTALVYYAGAKVAPVLGPIAVMSWFGLVLLATSAHLGLMYNKYGYPILTVLIACAAVFSIAGWTHNHDIRVLGTTEAGKVADVRSAFQHWLAERKDLPSYKQQAQPYPVYIISAEGGGVYAAYHAAMVLARLQDSCPRFAQHVFAISGVSGGSLGGSLFSALASQQAKNSEQLECDSTALEGPFQRATQRFFEHDVLSPLLAASLFPDFVQRFWPNPIPKFDRARALEHAIEQAWNDAAKPHGGKAFENSFKALWSHDGAAPALILNTTQTSNGRREIVAPFKVNFRIAPQSHAFLGAAVDIPLSTAVVLSARFPWLTPAATFRSDGSTRQLADGGYFENSGNETSHNLIWDLVMGDKDTLRTIDLPLNETVVKVKGEAVRVLFRLISIRVQFPPAPRGLSGEITAPVHTLLNARQERGVLSWRLAMRSLCPKCSDSISERDTVYAKVLDMSRHPFPLGWFLSKNSRRRLTEMVGDSHRCSLGKENVSQSHIENVGHCLHAVVSKHLQPSFGQVALPR